ncbi:MAG: SDR family NAD(P)-dependent oxidoreductase [Proteobacteria bacterium]|nr:SDR family NAD(P)-dependent oxidoreductase [Pseudomonadota bacterium]
MDSNRVIVITGSSKGIGLGLCRYFTNIGDIVVGFSRGVSSFEHPHYHHSQVDISDDAAVTAAFRNFAKHFGRLDILINNAGVLTSQYAMLMPGFSAEQMFKTNVFGAFLASREAAKIMMKKKWGRIISISSMAVPLRPAGDAIYSASKSALTQFTQVFAKEVAGYGITCNVLGVSAIETDMQQQIPPEKLQAIMNQLPIKKMASIDDITNAIDFFAKPESSSITGQILYLGGVF